MVTIRASDNKDEHRPSQTGGGVYRCAGALARADQGGLMALKRQLALKEIDVSTSCRSSTACGRPIKLPMRANASQPTTRLDQDTIRQIHNALRQAKGNLAIANSVYNKLAGLSREKLKEVAPMQVPGDTVLSDLVNRENDTEQRLATLVGRGLETNHPDVISARELLNTIRKQLDARLAGLINSLETRMQTERITVEAYPGTKSRQPRIRKFEAALTTKRRRVGKISMRGTSWL